MRVAKALAAAPCIFVVLLAVVLAGGEALGTTIVSLNSNATAAGSNNTRFPFGLQQGASTQRYQQIYDASIFASTAGVVDKIGFRAAPTNPLDTLGGSVTLQIRLAHSFKTPTTPPGPRLSSNTSSFFAQNIGSDETLVLDGFLKLSFPNTSIANQPNPFVQLDLEDLFFYNGTDSLLIDFQIFGSGFATSVLSQNGFDDENFNSQMESVFSGLGDSVGDASGTIRNFGGVVTQFVFLPVATPEPATLTLLATGLVGAGFVMRRRRARCM